MFSLLLSLWFFTVLFLEQHCFVQFKLQRHYEENQISCVPSFYYSTTKYKALSLPLPRKYLLDVNCFIIAL